MMVNTRIVSYLALVSALSSYSVRGYMVVQERSRYSRIGWTSFLRSHPPCSSFGDGPTHTTPEGRVPNITQWLTWSDQSLERLAKDGKGGMYDRINHVLNRDLKCNSPPIATPEQINEHPRFAVLSHGNQTDPIYNYVNAAGFKVFRWPEDRYYKLPSRYSAPDGADRSKRLEVMAQSVIEDVKVLEKAIRVRYPDSTVTLRDALLWNVYDDDGIRVGQMVLFDEELVSYGEGEDHDHAS